MAIRTVFIRLFGQRETKDLQAFPLSSRMEPQKLSLDTPYEPVTLFSYPRY